MQETRWDNTEVLTDSVAPDGPKVKQAMAALAPQPVAAPERVKKNRAVALHAPGSIVTLADGAEYQIGPRGNWLRLNKPLSKRARRRQGL